MCRPVLLDGHEIEAHLIGNRTYTLARELAEGCGSIVYWDAEASQARVLPALAPDWTRLPLLMEADERWRRRYPEHAMHQARFDFIWASALRARVDPGLLVAILIQEGTGSFNTNPENAGEYNGNGPDAHWIRDTGRAISHVRGKLTYYRQAVDAGFQVAAQQLDLEGTAIQFINWPGPIWNHEPPWGVYAQHADWWRGVTRYFEEVGGDVRLLSSYWLSDTTLVRAEPASLVSEPVADRPDLCSDPVGIQPRPGVVTWVT